MGFDNNYPNRKDWRKPYRERTAKAVDGSCRNHGGCPYCESGRKHSLRKKKMMADEAIDEFLRDDNGTESSD